MVSDIPTSHIWEHCKSLYITQLAFYIFLNIIFNNNHICFLTPELIKEKVVLLCDIVISGNVCSPKSSVCCFKNYWEVGYHKSQPVDFGRMTQVRIIYCVELGGYSNYKVSRPDPGTSHTPTEISIIEVKHKYSPPADRSLLSSLSSPAQVIR